MQEQTSQALRPWPTLLALWALASLHAVVLLIAQYMRPTPLGAPYVLDPLHYIGYAVSYEVFGMALVSTPLLLAALRLQSPVSAKRLAALQIAVLALSLCLSQLNHELQRFMGAQLSLDYIETYARVDRTPAVVWETLGHDLGGAYSGLWLYLAAPIFVALAWAVRARVPTLPSPRATLVVWSVFLAAGVFGPTAWLLSRGGGNRKLKVRPPVVLLYDSAREGVVDEQRYANIRDVIRETRRTWHVVDAAERCTFDDDQYLLRRTCKSEPAAAQAPRPNIVFISLETFRARDMGAFNPAMRRSPTPFLDQLANDPLSARYGRYVSNGIPTVFAFMSMHTSTLPHSERTAASAFTGTSLDSFPAKLRERGYTTLFFTGSDPDWDNQRYWLTRWYDETHYDPEQGERDRLLFAEATKRMITAGRSGKPFLATIASISNHTPFRSPEPALNIAHGTSAVDHLHNTMHYTDDVVRELFGALRSEPWFDDTVFIITGDHAFDLGERGVQYGHDNLRHESLWVPLIIHGRDPRLPRGPQLRVASHIDLAPTISELAGDASPNAYMGHSLLSSVTTECFAVSVRNHNLAIEAPTFSAYFPATGGPLVYAADDMLQEKPLPPESVVDLRVYEARARALSLVTDWAFEHDMFAPTL